MGCHVCGARQTDPAKGASPWQRGVAGGVQVLGCPDCQRAGTWAAALDTCAACGSAALIRRLGDTVCRSCGHVGDGVAAPGGEAPERPAAPAIADEVAAALDRFFGRAP